MGQWDTVQGEDGTVRQCRGRMGQCDSAGGGWDSVTVQGEDGTVTVQGEDGTVTLTEMASGRSLMFCQPQIVK